MLKTEAQANVARVTFLIASLNAGGAEKVLARIANEWSVAGRQVTILTMVGADYPVFYDLHPAVVRRPLDVAKTSRNPLQALANTARRLVALRRGIAQSRPDVVIVFGARTAVLTLVAAAGLGVPVIVSEHHASDRSVGAVWDRLRLLLYRRAAAVILLTQASLSHFPAAIRRRARVIQNPVLLPDPAVLTAPVARGPGHLLITMGSLREVKGVDKLISAFATVAAQYPDWSLRIWGEGPLRPQLEAQVAQLGLAERISLPGLTKEPFVELRKADFFAMASRSEGFPVVLAEALAVGLPVLSFDCNYGPREIVRDGVDGVLVPPGDLAAFSSAMAHLMTDDAARRSLAARAPEVIARLDLRRIMQLWEQLLIDVCGVRPAQLPDTERRNGA